MVVLLAMLYPEPEKGGRGKKSEAIKSAESAGFSSRRLNVAREIVRHPDLRDGVIADPAERFTSERLSDLPITSEAVAVDRVAQQPDQRGLFRVQSGRAPLGCDDTPPPC